MKTFLSKRITEIDVHVEQILHLSQCSTPKSKKSLMKSTVWDINLNLLNAGVECRRQVRILKVFFPKKLFTIIIISSHYLDSALKCIQMSTNKPSIGSVVLEDKPWNFIKLGPNEIFLHKNPTWKA